MAFIEYIFLDLSFVVTNILMKHCLSEICIETMERYKTSGYKLRVVTRVSPYNEASLSYQTPHCCKPHTVVQSWAIRPSQVHVCQT